MGVYWEVGKLFWFWNNKTPLRGDVWILGCLRSVFRYLSLTFLPSISDHRTIENWFWQKSNSGSVPETSTGGSCSYKLLSNVFLMFSLGSHCFGDPIPWRRLLQEIRFLQLGVDRPGLCLGLGGGGCHHLHWRQMFSQPLTCISFLARCCQLVSRTTPCTISQTPWSFCPTTRKCSSQKGQLASHLIHQFKAKLWWQGRDGGKRTHMCPRRPWCIADFQLLWGFVQLLGF